MLSFRRDRLSAEKQKRYLLASHNVTHMWKEKNVKGAEGVETEGMLRRLYPSVDLLDMEEDES